MRRSFQWLSLALISTCLLAQGKLGFNVKDMDLSVQPCENFYQYANGGWLKSQILPADKARWGSFNQLADSNRVVLMSIVKDLAASKSLKPGSPEQRVNDFYASAMNTELLEKKGIEPMKPFLALASSLKTQSDLPTLLGELHSRGFAGGFSMGVGVDQKNSKRHMVTFSQGGTTLPDRDFYLKDDLRSKNIRDKYVPHVARMFELVGFETAQANKNAQVVMTIETKLAEIQMDRTEMRDPNKRYNVKTPQKFQEENPGFDWSTYIAGRGVSKIEDLNVVQPSFFKSFATLSDQYSTEDWKVYLQWHVINGSAGALNKALGDQAFAFSKVLSGVEVQESRDKRMLSVVDNILPNEFGQLYVARTFSPVAKKKMIEMVKNLRLALKDSINKLEWMGPETRQKAIAKLDAFGVKIGYPDKWEVHNFDIKRDDYYGNLRRHSSMRLKENIAKLGQSPNKDEWSMTPPTVNARYSPSLNDILFPAGILQKPFFDPEADDAVNYGAIGYVIGHEITHGFDDSGSKYDGEGNLVNWWTPEDRKAYDYLTDLVVKQFDAYEPIKGERVNGKLTLGENIADLGGMKIAYAAWKMSLNGKPSTVIDGFTGEQRFFIGGAVIWRQLQREQALFQQLKTDPHSPGEFRVIGPMSNLPQFYEAFACKPPATMVRDEKVRPSIW
jgi:putative endopeptidase